MEPTQDIVTPEEAVVLEDADAGVVEPEEITEPTI